MDSLDPIEDAPNLSEVPAGETSLRTITMGVSDTEAIDAEVPDVQATTEEKFRDFDKDPVTHVVIQVSLSRQKDIFRTAGYHYDWNIPGPYWHFLGKIASKALYDDRIRLHVFNYVPVGRQEFIAYTTSVWTAAVKARKAQGVTELPPVNVLEARFKKPQPGQPLELFWQPARDLFTARIKQWNEDPDYANRVEGAADRCRVERRGTFFHQG